MDTSNLGNVDCDLPSAFVADGIQFGGVGTHDCALDHLRKSGRYPRGYDLVAHVAF